ncbi:MAG TPA: cytidine deaminase [Solirubrobacteraceae bacterium]|nr:cytidine deaminase [Solirubrobacteraceae bacterium]
MSAARRNVEIKAVDPDPARTLERALALGASDQGVIAQRDTYFAVPTGRLKLREQEPGGAELIAYERPDEVTVRVSAYRLVPVAHPGELRAALEAAAGIRVVVAKQRRLLLWRTVRIHLDDVEGLGPFVELEAVADAGSDLSGERGLVAHVRAALAIEDAALREGSYADAAIAAAPDPDLLALAREAAGRAYAPYSGFPVGAAVRTADGRRFAGANVENAAYPQGQCAEASALGAMVAGGGSDVAEVVVVSPGRELCAPCGGCRQRLREFMPADAPIHLADLERVRYTTTLRALLPLSLGPESLA